MCMTCDRVAGATDAFDVTNWHLGGVAGDPFGGLAGGLANGLGGLDLPWPGGPALGSGDGAFGEGPFGGGAFGEGGPKGTYGFVEGADVGETVATAQAVPAGEAIYGAISNAADEDWYAIQVTAGETYSIALNARGADGLSDPYLLVRGANGTVLAEDDDGGPGLNSALSFTATYTGTIIVEADAYYDETGAYTLTVTGDGGGGGGGGGGDDIGDTVATARRIQLDQDVRSTIDSSTDEDMFAVQVTAGQTYRITLDGDTSSANRLSDPYLRLFDASGRQIAFNDDSNGLNSELVYTATATGPLYVQADAFSTETGDYVLRVEETDTPPVADGPVQTITWDYRAPQVIDVYLAPAGTTVVEGTERVVTTGLDATERAAILDVLGEYEEVIDVDFRITNDLNEAEFVFLEGNLPGLYGYWNIGMDFGTGVIDGVRYDDLEGIGHFNSADASWNPASLQQGGFAYAVILHELGHGMGMAHPHDLGGGSTRMPDVYSSRGDYGPFDLNQGIYTVMSYNDGWRTGPNGAPPREDYGHQGSLMALDIARLQQAYGANTTTGAGNDTYLLPGTNGGGTFYSAIWDVGGVDTITAGNTRRVVTIDLNDATLDFSATGGGVMSQAAGIHGGYTIANGVVIENATGGFNNDTLRGNEVRNTLRGEGGNDRLEGLNGNDVLFGGAGDDVLFGGDASDILLGGGGADVLNGGRGRDFVSYMASSSGIVIDALDSSRNAGDATGDRLFLIENFVGSNHDDTVLGGNVANVLLGRNGNDTIDGRDGSDLIDGGGGADTLIGGAGADTFQFRFASESGRGRADHIADFERDADTIDLATIDANVRVAGNQAFDFVGTAAFSGQAGELRYGAGASGVSVIGDVNGDRVADFVLVVSGVTQLGADDFAL